MFQSFLNIILAILIFGALILIHELGHFLFARLFKVGINEFSIGMGPKIFSRRSKKSSIAYSIRALPIGGYVSMEGEDESSDNENAFCNKKIWQRFIITAAGPLMNIVLGFLCTVILVSSTGYLTTTTVHSFYEEATSSTQEGLLPGDTITKVGGVYVFTGNDMYYEIMHQGNKPIDITVERDGKTVVLEDVVFPTVKDEGTGIVFGRVDFFPTAEQLSFGGVIKHSFFRSVSTIKMIYDSIFDLFTGRFGISAVSGPVQITQTIGQAASTGFINVLYLIVVITINLGVFNLLPFPALDGGRIIFLLVELIIGRPINKKFESYVNLAGIMILFLIMILVTFKDVFSLIM